MNIKKARENKGFNQKELALIMKVSQPTVSDWETGKKIPSGENLKKLSELLDVTTDYLLGISNIPNLILYSNEEEDNDIRMINHAAILAMRLPIRERKLAARVFNSFVVDKIDWAESSVGQ